MSSFRHDATIVFRNSQKLLASLLSLHKTDFVNNQLWVRKGLSQGLLTTDQRLLLDSCEGKVIFFSCSSTVELKRF